MNSKNIAFVTVEPRDSQFMAFMSVEDLMLVEGNPESLLKKTAELYERTIIKMRSLMAEMQICKRQRKPIPARMMWKLGDTIFQIRNKLEEQSVQLNGVYAHFIRDLKVSRTWLERAIIFRRYIPKENLIPESLNWERCKTGIRRAAERLKKGLKID